MQPISTKTHYSSRLISPQRVTRPLFMLLTVIAASHIAVSPELQHTLAAFAATY